MNNRIKELVEQASDGNVINPEKFAELIVKDCIQIIGSWAEDDFAINGISVEICEHFDMEVDI